MKFVLKCFLNSMLYLAKPCLSKNMGAKFTVNLTLENFNIHACVQILQPHYRHVCNIIYNTQSNILFIKT